MIGYGKQSISEEDIESVVRVLKSDFLTQGPVVKEFERQLAKTVHSKYAIATNSATSALHIACLALGLKQGDCVWTSPISFVATANCALYCGAKVDFVDVNKSNGNISPQSLLKKLRQTPVHEHPKILIVVHMAGNPCDLNSLSDIAKKFNILIIEDACHALGADHEGSPIGSGVYSSVRIFSFHPVKMITTGEGGMAVTNDIELEKTMRLLISHGISKDKNEITFSEPWAYEQKILGFNYRMSDIQAALGLSQLHRLEDFVQSRRSIAIKYDTQISNPDIEVIKQNEFGSSSYHLYLIHVKNRKRLALFNYLKDKGVGSQVHYIPIYKQPYYREMDYKEELFPGSESYYEGVLTLPLYPDLKSSEQKKIIEAINEFE